MPNEQPAQGIPSRLDHGPAELPPILAFNVPDIPQPLLASCIRDTYGLEGEWLRLEGERELNHRLTTPSARYVVKVASIDEARDVIDFQCRALLHIETIDSSVPVPRVVPTSSGAPWSLVRDGSGRDYVIRVLTFIEAETLLERGPLGRGSFTKGDLFEIGSTIARVARALQGFHHSHADYPMAWDIKTGLVSSDIFVRRFDPALDRQVTAIIKHFESNVRPRLRRLRGQVIFNDCSEANLLAAPGTPFKIAGVIDFGDAIFGSLAQDLAVAIAAFVAWGNDPIESVCALAQGYHAAMPLEPGELEVVYDLALIRVILTIFLVDHKIRLMGKAPAWLSEMRDQQEGALKDLLSLDRETVRGKLLAACAELPRIAPMATPAEAVPDISALLARREAVLGHTFTFYRKPLHIVRGSGTRLYDAQGREYLDVYNNVANVGHCHPHVLNALARQAATLNTSTRYLHEAIVELGERLTATLPAGLDTCMFVCTGSEANDLATRIARVVTGNHGVVVVENAYHGGTTLANDLSPIEYPIELKPDWLELLPAPNLYRGPHRTGENDLAGKYAGYFEGLVETLAAKGHKPAALMMDCIFDGTGGLVPPEGYVKEVFRRARAAGALCIADEVQIGFARSGTHMWGFEAFDAVPDIVTMGKPMGNGHPIAAVVTTADIARRFHKHFLYFNTFGGNPVSCAVANATLDVLQGEGLQARALSTGRQLMEGMRKLQARHPIIGHIHGRGLFLGVDLVRDREKRTPARPEARWFTERMKERRVLIASTGPLGNILKVRPPLAFSAGDAEIFLAAFEDTLNEYARDPAASRLGAD